MQARRIAAGLAFASVAALAAFGMSCGSGAVGMDHDAGTRDAGGNDANPDVDATPPPAPDIEAVPAAVHFGAPPLGIEVPAGVTLWNTGDADLEIHLLEVVLGAPAQLIGLSPEGTPSPPLVVPPQTSVDLSVSLLMQSGDPDLGELRIHSNDPDEPTLSIPMSVDLLGSPALEICALDAGIPDPEPFVDCVVSPMTQTPVVVFSGIPFQTPADRRVVLRNSGDGNAPLVVTDAVLTGFNGFENYAFLFSTEAFRLEEDPVTGDRIEVPETLPAILRPADPGAGLEADRLYFRIHLAPASGGSIPPGYLVFHSNDAQGERAVDIVASVECPPCFVEVDPFHGCECVYTGPEICDGCDNDCNGIVDDGCP